MRHSLRIVDCSPLRKSGFTSTLLFHLPGVTLARLIPAAAVCSQEESRLLRSSWLNDPFHADDVAALQMSRRRLCRDVSSFRLTLLIAEFASPFVGFAVGLRPVCVTPPAARLQVTSSQTQMDHFQPAAAGQCVKRIPVYYILSGHEYFTHFCLTVALTLLRVRFCIMLCLSRMWVKKVVADGRSTEDKQRHRVRLLLESPA